MRLDKFLKVSRLVKRRSVAKVLADKENFYINDRLAKPSSNVDVNDKIDLYLGRHHLTVIVKLVKENALAKDAESMYELINDEILED